MVRDQWSVDGHLGMLQVHGEWFWVWLVWLMVVDTFPNFRACLVTYIEASARSIQVVNPWKWSQKSYNPGVGYSSFDPKLLAQNQRYEVGTNFGGETTNMKISTTVIPHTINRIPTENEHIPMENQWKISDYQWNKKMSDYQATPKCAIWHIPMENEQLPSYPCGNSL